MTSTQSTATHPLVGRVIRVQYGVQRPEYANHLIVDVTNDDGDLTLWFEESGLHGIALEPGVDLLAPDSPLLAHGLNTNYPRRV